MEYMIPMFHLLLHEKTSHAEIKLTINKVIVEFKNRFSHRVGFVTSSKYLTKITTIKIRLPSNEMISAKMLLYIIKMFFIDKYCSHKTVLLN